jgi:hypothetical protein
MQLMVKTVSKSDNAAPASMQVAEARSGLGRSWNFRFPSAIQMGMPSNTEFLRRGPRPVRWTKWMTGLMGSGLIAAFQCSHVRAADARIFAQGAQHPLLLAYASPPTRSASSSGMSLAATTSTNMSLAGLHFTTEDQSPVWLGELSRPSQPEADMDLPLVHKKLHSRFSHDATAGLETGYGQFFSAQKLGRLGISGAGLQDTDWFYLKVSLRF